MTKSKEDIESIGKSNRTNPVNILENVKSKHNRTKSDMQVGSNHIRDRLITHFRRKNSFKTSFKKDDQHGKHYEVIEEEREARVIDDKNPKLKSKRLSRDFSSVKKIQNSNTKKRDLFEHTPRTDIDHIFQTSRVVTKDTIEEITRNHAKDFDRVKKHDWKVLSPNRDLRLDLLNSANNRIGLIKTINAHLDSVRRVDFFNSSMLLSAGEDGVVKEWKVEKSGDKVTIENIHNYRYHTAPIVSSAMSNHYHMSGDVSGKLLVMEHVKDSWQFSRVFSTGNEPIWSIDYCKRDNMLVSTTPNKVKFWIVDQLSDKNANSVLSSTKVFYNETKWHSNGQCVISSCDSEYKNSSFSLYDVHKEKEVLKLTQDLTASNCFRLLKEKDLLVSCNEDHTVSIYDIRGSALVKNFVAHSNPITAMDIDESSQTLITGDSDGSMRLWDLQSLRCIQELSVHKKKFNDSIHDIKINPESQIVATAGADSTIRLFSLN